jgi:hypothetical protein
MQGKNQGRLVCRLCLAKRIINSQVIERAIKHPWQQGRETPATCRTFALRPNHQAENGERFLRQMLVYW